MLSQYPAFNNIYEKLPWSEKEFKDLETLANHLSRNPDKVDEYIGSPKAQELTEFLDKYVNSGIQYLDGEVGMLVGAGASLLTGSPFLTMPLFSLVGAYVGKKITEKKIEKYKSLLDKLSSD